MIDSTRLAQVVHGLRLILRLEPGGFSFFEKSYSGFIRSFFPALVLAPLHIIHLALVYDPGKTETAAPGSGTETMSVIARSSFWDAIPYITTEFLAYVLSWTLFPFVMIYVTRLLGCSRHYFAYIVPYNWFQLLLGLVVLPLTLLIDLQVIGLNGAALLNFVVLGMFIAYGTFLARTGLEVATSTAFGIVVLDILLSLLSDEIIGRIH
jgi:hypothetical protein